MQSCIEVASLAYKDVYCNACSPQSLICEAASAAIWGDVVRDYQEQIVVTVQPAFPPRPGSEQIDALGPICGNEPLDYFGKDWIFVKKFLVHSAGLHNTFPGNMSPLKVQITNPV